jgi:hypothetical protein
MFHRLQQACIFAHLSLKPALLLAIPLLCLTSPPRNHAQFEPNPFAEDLEPGVEAASVAYKYRLFSLGSIRLVARCEVHCWTNKRGE